MEFIDIVDFDFSNPEEYGFSKIRKLKGGSLSIISSTDKRKILHSLRQFDYVYFPIYEADVELITSVVKKEKKFIISLSDILEKKGFDRSITLYKLRRFIEFCKSYNAKFVIASFAKSEYMIRSPKEIAAIASLIGLNENQAFMALSG